jgi:hypothetical protein
MNRVYVKRTGSAEHRRVALAAASKRMAGWVIMGEIRLHFDDHARQSFAFSELPDENLAKQILGHRRRVTMIERIVKA